MTKEFESVCSKGEIIYLGTPQSTESIYNNLPGRGYSIRIWTGRYPTYEQEANYGDMLAPMIVQDMILDPALRKGHGLDCLQGKPTCPEMFPEDTLLGKELSMGSAKFQLQFMLNTKLTDEERYPLKLRNLIVQDYSFESGPVLPVWTNTPGNLYQSPSVNGKYKLYRALYNEYEYRPFDQRVMYIDPAGKNPLPALNPSNSVKLPMGQYRAKPCAMQGKCRDYPKGVGASASKRWKAAA